MSKFYGYFYPELSHWFGVNAVQRLEKKIGSCALRSLEYKLLSLIEQNDHRECALKELFDVHQPSIY